MTRNYPHIYRQAFLESYRKIRQEHPGAVGEELAELSFMAALQWTLSSPIVTNGEEETDSDPGPLIGM